MHLMVHMLQVVDQLMVIVKTVTFAITEAKTQHFVTIE